MAAKIALLVIASAAVALGASENNTILLQLGGVVTGGGEWGSCLAMFCCVINRLRRQCYPRQATTHHTEIG